jgi:hypothetical protein
MEGRPEGGAHSGGACEAQTMAATAGGPTAPVAGPAGALVPAAKKGRLMGGWESATVVAHESDVLTRVGSDSLDSGEGGSQSSQNDPGNGRSDGTRRAHPRGTDHGSAHANV